MGVCLTQFFWRKAANLNLLWAKYSYMPVSSQYPSATAVKNKCNSFSLPVNSLILKFWWADSMKLFIWRSRSLGVLQSSKLHCSAAKSLQSCSTLCDPIDGSPPGSPVPGILQARTLEWVAISFSNAWKWKVNVKSLSRVRLLVTPWTAAYQAPLSMGFSRQEYWSTH